jgi:fatty acid desaturase
MRLWLKDSERRPDPAPVKTDDRKAFLVGIVGWVIALAAFIALLPMLTELGHTWWLWTAVAGLAIGLIGIVYTTWHQKQG